MKEAHERLLAVISHTRLSKNAFAKRIGYSNGTVIYQVLDGRNGVSPKLAKRICDEFTEINFDWLLNNKGKMLNNEIKEIQKETSLEEEVAFLRKHIKGLDARIELLEQQIDAQITNPNKELA